MKKTVLLLLTFATCPVLAAPLCSHLFSDGLSLHTQNSEALRDLRVDRARDLRLFDDYKFLADLSAKSLSPAQERAVLKQTEALEKNGKEREALKFYIDAKYEYRPELLPVKSQELQPTWTIRDRRHQATVEHIEKMWTELVRQTPKETRSSLIPLPNPLLIPGARFQEGYYWDSYFAFPTLLKTGRERIVKGQVDNFLFLLKNYGLIPNGTRDYYLSRSQPPLISQMVRLVLEHEMNKGPLTPEYRRWLSEAYLLIKRDYEQFWMNGNTRWDKKTGLNHYWDQLNTPRPERHSSDKESEISKTYRDVRAEAESGKDFTAAYEGEATQYGSVALNSILFQVEKDLSWMARLLNRSHDIAKFESAAVFRQRAMNKYMWDAKSGVYRDVHLKTLAQSEIITADAFIPLHYQIPLPNQARELVKTTLRVMEKEGGIMSAEKETGKQWDAPYGWAPHHYFAISGLMKNGFKEDAQRVAQKWVRSVDRIYQETGKVIEKIDAVRGGVPHEAGDKYPTQDGFLWTNGVYMWSLTDILQLPLVQKK